MVKGRNKDFLVNGLKMIFKKNYGIDISETEIDSTISYAENFYELYHKFISHKNISIQEL